MKKYKDAKKIMICSEGWKINEPQNMLLQQVLSPIYNEIKKIQILFYSKSNLKILSILLKQMYLILI